MIYTLTINPSIDFINQVDKFELSKISKSSNAFFIPGGKGVNVSLILNELNIDSIALGFKSNFTGDFLTKSLNELNVKNDLIEVDGYTRINVKIISDKETALNTDTLLVTEQGIDKLKKKLQGLKANDVLIISGNITKTMNKNFYDEVLQIINPKVTLIVDSIQELLLSTLKYKPLMIKPNREELEELFNVSIANEEEVLKYAMKLQKMGAQNVIVSLDKEGALLIDSNNKKYFLKNLDVPFVSSVGAGDSMVAGFVAGLCMEYSIFDCFMLGAACGNATVSSDRLANKEQILKNYYEYKKIYKL